LRQCTVDKHKEEAVQSVEKKTGGTVWRTHFWRNYLAKRTLKKWSTGEADSSGSRQQMFVRRSCTQQNTLSAGRLAAVFVVTGC